MLQHEAVLGTITLPYHSTTYVMKNSTLFLQTANRKSVMIVLVALMALFSRSLHAQNYRTIEAYMDDFGKNEMFVKKALIDYSATIVESQRDSRSQTTSGRIIDKLASINKNLLTNNKGFENNTLLRDSFIKMNEKTIESLKNGSLILNDYDYQSALPFNEILANLARKEKAMTEYYQEVKNFDKSKRVFGSQFNVGFKNKSEKNVLEYNARQNFLFYKMNVIDQKLVNLLHAKDQSGVAQCLQLIEAFHQDVVSKTNQYKDVFKDNSLNEANVRFANLIASQQSAFGTLFTAYAEASAQLAALKASKGPETTASVAAYNQKVKSFNAKKNAFFAAFDQIQATKKAMVDHWVIANSRFLQKNSEFENIHEHYTLPDSKLASR
jgi:hypothetical protein